MRVLVSLEHRFLRTPDQSVWTATMNSFSFWERYLEVFDEVRVLARVQDVERADPQWLRADGPGVTFSSIPYFVGPLQYAQSYWSVRRAVSEAVRDCEAVVMRVPSVLSHEVRRCLKKAKHPFSLEVVGDPFDVFAPGSVEHPLRPFFRTWFTKNLTQQCQEAKAVSYVTSSTLQKRYPAQAMAVGISDVMLPESAFTTSYSSVELDEKQILHSSPVRVPQNGKTIISFVGSLEQLYKAPDVLLSAVSKAISWGLDLELHMVGEGRFRPMLEQSAKVLGLQQRCLFYGQLPSGRAVQEVLDRSDLFVLPSRVEGLPRVIIEAMARGLPCIGSTAGGIPELLDEHCLVPVGNADALAEKIRSVVTDPERQRAMATRNLAKAREYSDEVLRAKRIEFYQFTKNYTQDWLRQRTALGAMSHGLG